MHGHRGHWPVGPAVRDEGRDAADVLLEEPVPAPLGADAKVIQTPR